MRSRPCVQCGHLPAGQASSTGLRPGCLFSQRRRSTTSALGHGEFLVFILSVAGMLCCLPLTRLATFGLEWVVVGGGPRAPRVVFFL